MSVNVDPTGQTPSPITSPKLVEAHGKVKLGMAKTIAGSLILLVLIAGYFVLLAMGKESNAILAIVAGGVGYLLGGRGGASGV